MTIAWDEWGVPTVTEESDLEVCRGLGYAQAVAHAGQVLELYGVARGRAAALWGETYAGGDVQHAELGLDRHVEEWVVAQEEATLARLDAFCQGFNAACAEDVERGAARRDALPVTPRDVVAHAMTVFLNFARMWDDGRAFPSAADVLAAQAGVQAGSSAWAVAAGRSTTGHANLVINPHLAWLGFNLFFEVRCISPGRRFHGVALVGFPWPVMGFSPYVGWAHTVNPVPLMWVYELDVADDSYSFDGRRVPLEIEDHVIEVRDGAPRTVRERRSVHGPVVVAPDGRDVAVRVAGVLHEPATGTLEAWWRMSLAHDVEGVLAAARQRPLAMFNIIAADSAGSVAAAYGGAPPVRPEGTYSDALRRLPGNDPRQLWRSVHPPQVLPQVVDPAGGWVQNVNDPPWWYCEPPLDPATYPAGIAPPPTTLRDIRSPLSRARLIGRDQIRPEQLLDLKWEIRAALADLVLDELCSAAESEPDLREAVDVLRAWDRLAGADSPGYPLFFAWASTHLPVFSPFLGDRVLIPSARPGGLPTGLVDIEKAVGDLRQAVALLSALGLGPDVTLGTLAVVSDGLKVVPAVGGPTYLGIFKCLEVLPGATPWTAFGGDTWVATVEFRAGGAHASGLLVYGNSTEPTAPVSSSQVELFAESRLRPITPLLV